MYKKMIYISLILVVPCATYSANILLWHFNPKEADTLYDPEAGMMTESDHWIRKSLENCGYTYDYRDELTLPADISSYDLVMIAQGWLTC